MKKLRILLTGGGTGGGSGSEGSGSGTTTSTSTPPQGGGDDVGIKAFFLASVGGARGLADYIFSLFQKFFEKFF